MDTTKLPRRVFASVFLLWLAWGISAVALAVNSYRFSTPMRGVVSGIVVLALQALLIYFIGRRSNLARVILTVIILLGFPGLLVVGRLLEAGWILSAAMTGVAFSLRVIAAYLYLTGDSRLWFGGQILPHEGEPDA
jgi:hypothetical protein